MKENGGGGRRSVLQRGPSRFIEPVETKQSLHFFKIMLHSSISEEKLRMSKNFVGMYGQELSSKALLTVPNGGVWEMGLEKANGQIWFCDNWNNFVDYYSIKYGFLLVFKYKGNSSFQVLIFDTTTSEIQYPHSHGDAIELEDEDQKSDSIISIPSSSGYSEQYVDDECVYRPLASKMTRAILRSDSTKSYGVQTRNSTRTKSEICDREIESKRRKVENQRCKVEDDTELKDFHAVKNETRQKRASRTQTATSNGKEMAIRAATESMKTRNPSFMVTLYHRNINKSYLYIPPSFCTKYLDTEEEIIELQAGSKGKKWKVCCYMAGTWSKRMGRGWRLFSKENNLKAGDVLVFELVKRSKSRLMKFTVFTSAEFETIK